MIDYWSLNHALSTVKVMTIEWQQDGVKEELGKM
jgi:hypothetical protein